MIKRSIMNLVEKTMHEMTFENNGELVLLPNIDNIANRAGVTEGEVRRCLAVMMLDEHEDIEEDLEEDLEDIDLSDFNFNFLEGKIVDARELVSMIIGQVMNKGNLEKEFAIRIIDLIYSHVR